MTSVRIFFIGGLMSFRALFNWMNPWIFVPTTLLGPITQILLFAYVGRAAGVGDDEFFIIGNALNYAAIPGMFAMTFTIAGERFAQTLGLVLVSPARRIPLFLGRALPVIVNGWGTAMIGIVSGVWLLDAHIPAGSWPLIALVVAVGCLSTAGIGLVMGAVNLVYRDGATLGNVVFLVLLIFTGTNVALDDLPSWMAAIGRFLPLSHAIEASRMVADGATWGAVQGLVGRELLIGLVYAVLGLLALRWLEHLSRTHATLDRV
ncbi:ABC transporter permease [Nocardioides sp.]|uniref:ABC transporter permease n=1 Tax=Nocardioides sp. TaxID=35761 RepID=UPI002B8D4DE7|nr:ABC transporter permease [Nocardioides sp.]HXH79046.1 ABC transporter permease [Nocardioides sp.]